MSTDPTSTSTPAMSPPSGSVMHGRDGLRGEIEQVLDGRAIVRLSDGKRVLIPATALRRESDGDSPTDGSADVYHVDLTPDHVSRAQRTQGNPGAGSAGSGDSGEEIEHIVIPVIEERVNVGKEAVQTGRIRVHKTVHEEEREVEQELLRQNVSVDRVQLNKILPEGDEPPQARQEGDTLIVPLLEEVLVVEKRLVLREELRVRRLSGREVSKQSVVARREEAKVERLPPALHADHPAEPAR